VSDIEKAIKRLEKSAKKERELLTEEGTAIKKAVAEATAKVEAEYSILIDKARTETAEAERLVKDAQRRIHKALDLNTTPNRSGTRAPRGSRETTLLNFFKAHPDSTVSDAASADGVSPNGYYPVVKKLVEKGKLKKDGKTYRVA
jgi:hypothetical protein